MFHTRLPQQNPLPPEALDQPQTHRPLQIAVPASSSGSPPACLHSLFSGTVLTDVSVADDHHTM